MVETILKSAKDGSGDDYWRSRMEGHCMKVDKEICESEIALVYGFGKGIGFSEKEISQKFAEMIQRNYVPSLESIC